MKPAQASSTAKLIAASTILLASDPLTLEQVDPDAAAWCAQLLSGNKMDRALAWSAGYRPTAHVWKWLEQHTHPGIVSHFAWRKRWIAQRCRLALAEGFERVVVLGAGLDTLALGLSQITPKVEWIEIDHPASQRAKQACRMSLLRCGSCRWI